MQNFQLFLVQLYPGTKIVSTSLMRNTRSRTILEVARLSDMACLKEPSQVLPPFVSTVIVSTSNMLAGPLNQLKNRYASPISMHKLMHNPASKNRHWITPTARRLRHPALCDNKKAHSSPVHEQKHLCASCISIQERSRMSPEYQLNAGDVNAAYKLHFGDTSSTGVIPPGIYFHQRRPAGGELRARSDLRASGSSPISKGYRWPLPPPSLRASHAAGSPARPPGGISIKTPTLNNSDRAQASASSMVRRQTDTAIFCARTNEKHLCTSCISIQERSRMPPRT